MSKRQFYILSVAVLAGLFGCQPDTQTQPAENTATAPAVVASAPAPAVTESKATKPVPKELQLAQASKCFSCHTIDKKLVGPAWKDIAAKYRGQKDAEAKLVDKVSKGGSGIWGAVPMPPNAPQIKQSDINTLVRYILSLK